VSGAYVTISGTNLNLSNPVLVSPSGTGTFTFTGSTPYPDPQTVQVTAATGTAPADTATANVVVTPPPENNLPCPQCPAMAGQPINLTNGNVWITQQDYSLPGLGGGLSISRTWNSLWRSNDYTLPIAGMFGDSWRSTYEEFLHIINGNNVKYLRANGDGWYFQWNSSLGNYQVVTLKISTRL
jgi:hypothetical protein